jgi:hypothetical protein
MPNALSAYSATRRPVIERGNGRGIPGRLGPRGSSLQPPSAPASAAGGGGGTRHDSEPPPLGLSKHSVPGTAAHSASVMQTVRELPGHNAVVGSGVEQVGLPPT